MVYQKNVNFVPQTPEEAISCDKSAEWKNATRVEFNALKKNKTWDMVDLPVGKTAIGCKWVYAIKTTKNGDIERYKARLVAKGCSQKYDVNYQETSFPLIRYENIRLLFAIAVNKDMHLHQIGIVSAYLNGDLNEAKDVR
ncbi:uncharacterized mitochondrial protein AtMg00820-like [Lucilia sericata]|uniref:uncharacterized mitochondrial protein AtMg00820-like n=1 Tax=Lucilia sericata TaxID=13632 RepID=UPI0018A83A98|nr:uncharacterized mitochondrial protein AtMg00820-like [Lucilia sericata]